LKAPKAWRDPFGTDAPLPPITLGEALIRLRRLINDCDDLILELERDDELARDPRPRVRTVH